MSRPTRRRVVGRRAKARPPDPEPFRVLIAAHRPRYRSRAEHAVDVPGWEVRSLLNREDPIGLINRKPPDIFIISVDPETKTNVGYLRAAQRYRPGGMRIIGLFEDAETAAEFAGQCDTAFAAPWRHAEVHTAALTIHEAIRGHRPAVKPAVDTGDD